MAEKLIFSEKDLTFYLDSTFGCYASSERPASFSLTDGGEYTIKWDNETYTRTAFAFTSADVSACVAVGNPVAAGQAANEDTFAIVYDSTHNYAWFLSLEAKDSHTVGIYQIVADEPEVPEEPETPEEPEGIVLKDRNGKDVAYYGIETVTFDTTTEGKQQVYTKGVAVEGMEIVPDFSGGDMPVTAPKGALVKSATLKKPDTLTPENVRAGVDVGGVTGTLPVYETLEDLPIALDFSGGDQTIAAPEGTAVKSAVIRKPEMLKPENVKNGVEIAGILGTLASGGVKAKYASFSPTSAAVGARISIDFGFVPDLLLVMCMYNGSRSTSYGRVYFGLSTAAAPLFGMTYPPNYVFYDSSSNWNIQQSTGGIEDATKTSNPIYAADETGFNIGYKGAWNNKFYYVFAAKFT